LGEDKKGRMKEERNGGTRIDKKVIKEDKIKGEKPRKKKERK
jgi:hypothetical protein